MKDYMIAFPQPIYVPFYICVSDVYPVIFIEAVHFSVRDDGIIRKLAAYIIPGINDEGKKEVLDIEVGEDESCKY